MRDSDSKPKTQHISSMPPGAFSFDSKSPPKKTKKHPVQLEIISH